MAVQTPIETAEDLIDRFDLHVGGAPVSLKALELVYIPVYMDLSECGLPAMVWLPSDRPEATMEHPIHILLETDLDSPERRLAYAHEIGHVVCGHPGSLRARQVDNWFGDRHEREAWEFAAKLLVPDSVRWLMETEQALASTCEVPEWLVGLEWR